MNLKRIIILSVLIMSVLCNVNSQCVAIDNYSFINTNSDTAIYFGQSKQQFKEFTKKFSQMIRLGNCQVNILHLGDSHLQADLYTEQARKNFQSFADGLDGATGMITPYVKGAPPTYKINFSASWKSFDILSTSNSAFLGLWGTTAYTTAKDNTIIITINNKNTVKHDFNSFKIYHSALNDDIEISLNDCPAAYRKTYYKNKGYTEFIFANYLQEIKINITNNSSAVFYVYGFYFNNDNPGVIYNVSGTNGASAKSYLNAANFDKHLALTDCDLIIISLGTNDTYEPGGENTFEENLSLLIKKIRQTKVNVPILLTTPVECWYHRKQINPRQQQTVNIIYNVAKQNDCMLLDMYEIMGGKNSCSKLFEHKLMQADKVHLTAKGYQLQGDLLYNALWREFEKNL